VVRVHVKQSFQFSSTKMVFCLPFLARSFISPSLPLSLPPLLVPPLSVQVLSLSPSFSLYLPLEMTMFYLRFPALSGPSPFLLAQAFPLSVPLGALIRDDDGLSPLRYSLHPLAILPSTSPSFALPLRLSSFATLLEVRRSHLIKAWWPMVQVSRSSVYMHLSLARARYPDTCQAGRPIKGCISVGYLQSSFLDQGA
jgi:hypothetical protein